MKRGRPIQIGTSHNGSGEYGTGWSGNAWQYNNNRLHPKYTATVFVRQYTRLLNWRRIHAVLQFIEMATKNNSNDDDEGVRYSNRTLCDDTEQIMWATKVPCCNLKHHWLSEGNQIATMLDENKYQWTCACKLVSKTITAQRMHTELQFVHQYRNKMRSYDRSHEMCTR